MKRKRKIYDSSFKTKAIQLSTKRTNISELAPDLGISITLLYKEYEEFSEGSFPHKRHLKLIHEQEKIYELEKRLKDAELERDI